MSRNGSRSLPRKLTSRRVNFCLRIFLRALALFFVGVLPGVTPGLGRLHGTESEAPMDRDDLAEGEAIDVQPRTRVSHCQMASRCMLPIPEGSSIKTLRAVEHRSSGHRLSNNLMAPLRC
jgi:hypothetical protein